MEQLEKLVIDLLKQLGIGFNVSKMYPPGHPTYDRIAEQVIDILLKFPQKYRTLSLYFFENLVLFEDKRIDTSRVPAVQALAKHFFRINIESISIDRDVSKEDVKGLFEVLSNPPRKFKDVEDPTEFLLQKGIERIRFNEVKFSLSSAGGEKEIKFDLDSILREIEKADDPMEVVQHVPGDNLVEKTKNLVKNADTLNPLQLSRVFAGLLREGGEKTFYEFLNDEELKQKIREIMETMDESDFMVLLSEIPREKRGEILVFIPEDKRSKLLKKIPSFLLGGGAGGTGLVSGTGAGGGGGSSSSVETAEKTGIPGGTVTGTDTEIQRQPGQQVVSSGTGTGGGEGMGTGIETGTGSGEIAGATSEIEERIDKIIKKFDELRDEEKEKEIRDIFLNLVGIDIREDFESKKIKDVVAALKIVSYYLLEKYGEEGFSGLSLVVSQILKILSPKLKQRFIEESEKFKEIAASIRNVLEEMSDEELVSLFGGLEEGEAAVPDTIKDILVKRKFHGKSEIGVQDKELEILERVTREKHLVITGEKKLKFMEKELEEGIGASEIENVLRPLVEKIEKGDENERSSAVNAISALAISFIKADKFGPLENILDLIKSKISDEEHPAVIFSYIEGLEKIIGEAKAKGHKLIVEEIQRTFRDLLDSETKKKMAIRALGKVGTEFALRMLLTALWDEDTEEDVKEALLTSGREGFNALKEIFPEVENMGIRRRIAKILAAFPSEYRREFYDGLFEKNWKTQRDIAFILGESKDPEGVPLLIKLLKTAQDIVRLEAARSLGKIGDPSAEEALIEVYAEYPSKDVKNECIRTLLKIGTEKSINAVMQFIDEKLNNNEFTDLFLPALNFILKFLPEKAYPVIEKILFEKTFLKKPKYPSQLRTEIVRIISRYKTDRIRKYIQDLLNDPDSSVKLAASIGIKRLEESESDRN